MMDLSTLTDEQLQSFVARTPIGRMELVFHRAALDELKRRREAKLNSNK